MGERYVESIWSIDEDEDVVGLTEPRRDDWMLINHFNINLLVVVQIFEGELLFEFVEKGHLECLTHAGLHPELHANILIE